MDTEVLAQIWSVLPDGYVFLPRIKGWKKNARGKLEAEKYREGEAYTPQVALEKLSEWDTTGIDMYFTPLTYREPARKKEHVNPSRVLFADLDDCDPRKLPAEIRPTTYWKSSKNHFQGLWLLDEELPVDEFEQLNKAVSYAVGADKSGWDLTQILRVPGTTNYKRGNPDNGELLYHSNTPMSVSTLKAHLPELPKAGASDTEWPIPKRALDLLQASDCPVGERSERLWELEKLLVESGMPVAEMFRILKPSGWNKFAERTDGDTALLKDIMKAEAEYKVSRINAGITVAPERTLTDFYGLVTSDAPKPTYMVDGFLVDGSVGAAAGEPKTMKSTVVLDLAVSVASGKPFLGRYRVLKSCPVLYVQEENSKNDIIHRLQRIALHHGVAISTSIGVHVADIPLYVMNNEGINLTDQADRDNLESIIQNNGIQLVILDPWYMMVAGIDEDKSKDVGPILKYLTYLRNQYECTVLLVHHFKKGDTVRPGQRMRGSSVFHAWVESGLYFCVKKGKPGVIVVDREFRSLTSAGPLTLTFSQDETAYDVTVEESISHLSAGHAPIQTIQPLQTGDEDDDDDTLEDGALSEDVPIATGQPRTWDECAKAGMNIEQTTDLLGMAREDLIRIVDKAVQRGNVFGRLDDNAVDFSGLRW